MIAEIIMTGVMTGETGEMIEEEEEIAEVEAEEDNKLRGVSCELRAFNK